MSKVSTVFFVHYPPVTLADLNVRCTLLPKTGCLHFCCQSPSCFMLLPLPISIHKNNPFCPCT